MPRPPQTPAAPFLSPYRKCLGSDRTSSPQPYAPRHFRSRLATIRSCERLRIAADLSGRHKPRRPFVLSSEQSCLLYFAGSEHDFSDGIDHGAGGFQRNQVTTLEVDLLSSR